MLNNLIYSGNQNYCKEILQNLIMCSLIQVNNWRLLLVLRNALDSIKIQFKD